MPRKTIHSHSHQPIIPSTNETPVSSTYTPELKEAAQTLQNHLANEPWLVGVGVGRKKGTAYLFAYVTDQAKAKEGVPHTWKGYRVKVEMRGRPRPASQKEGT